METSFTPAEPGIGWFDIALGTKYLMGIIFIYPIFQANITPFGAAGG